MGPPQPAFVFSSVRAREDHLGCHCQSCSSDNNFGEHDSVRSARRNPMPKHHTLACVLFASTMLTTAGAAISAEVTAERLIHADKEPQNWLMNHRTYDAQRYSPLDRINKANAKDLKLAYAVALGGTWANANLESTPLAEDGYLYVVDQWGVLYEIDGRSGELGRILWRMDPG